MNSRRLIALLLTIALLIMAPATTYAKDGVDDDNPSIRSGDDDSNRGSDDDDDHDDDDDDFDDDDGFDDDSVSAALLANPEYMKLLQMKKTLSAEIDALKAKLDAAKDADNETAENQIEAQMRALKNQKDAVEAQMFQMAGADRFTPFDSAKNKADSELTALKASRHQVEIELQQIRAALLAGTVSDVDAARARIVELEKQKDALQAQIRAKKEELRGLLRNLYSDSEWANLGSLISQLNSNRNTIALPANSILMAGQKVKFDAPPIIVSGRVLIPVRSVTTALGATVTWDDSDQKVIISRDGVVLEFELGDDSMKVNGRSVPLDVPAQIINGRMVVPLRALVERLGLDVEWDDTSKIVDIQ